MFFIQEPQIVCCSNRSRLWPWTWLNQNSCERTLSASVTFVHVTLTITLFKRGQKRVVERPGVRTREEKEKSEREQFISCMQILIKCCSSLTLQYACTSTHMCPVHARAYTYTHASAHRSSLNLDNRQIFCKVQLPLPHVHSFHLWQIFACKIKNN